MQISGPPSASVTCRGPWDLEAPGAEGPAMGTCMGLAWVRKCLASARGAFHVLGFMKAAFACIMLWLEQQWLVDSIDHVTRMQFR